MNNEIEELQVFYAALDSMRTHLYKLDAAVGSWYRSAMSVGYEGLAREYAFEAWAYEMELYALRREISSEYPI